MARGYQDPTLFEPSSERGGIAAGKAGSHDLGFISVHLGAETLEHPTHLPGKIQHALFDGLRPERQQHLDRSTHRIDRWKRQAAPFVLFCGMDRPRFAMMEGVD